MKVEQNTFGVSGMSQDVDDPDHSKACLLTAFSSTVMHGS